MKAESDLAIPAVNLHRTSLLIIGSSLRMSTRTHALLRQQKQARYAIFVDIKVT